jgi:hypothetical protein
MSVSSTTPPQLPAVSGEPRHAVPTALAYTLQRARAAELTARGSQRRIAFRATRYLLCGARLAGFSPNTLASCLGVTIGSVAARSGIDGLLSSDHFCQLANTSPEDIDRWQTARHLTAGQLGPDGLNYFLASELVHALIRK